MQDYEKGFLHRYFLNNSSNRLHKWLHYFDIYERHLSKFRNHSPVILEIGVFGGGSLQMWLEYFGKGSKVVGLDIDPKCKVHEQTSIEIFIGSQDDPQVIERILRKYPNIDIIIDDGSHINDHMKKSFQLLYQHINDNGVYLIEDVHTSYWNEYGGGVGKNDSFIEYAKRKIDELNAVHSRGAIPISSFTRNTDSISFYDSVVVFEKRPQGSRQNLITEGF